MGFYNPHAPWVIGQEWVPIRDESIGFSPAVNVYEIGHQFSLTASRTLQDGRFYVNALPASLAAGQVFMMSVYPAGREAESGPVRSVIIPVSSGSITGASAGLQGGSTFAEVVADPSDQKFAFTSAGANANFAVSFGVSQYAQLLQGKRILEVNLLYNIGDTTVVPAGGGTPTDYVNFYLANDFTVRQLLNSGVPYGGGNLFGTSGWNSATVTIDPAGDKLPAPITRKLPLGEIDQIWATVNDPWWTTERLPWVLDGLLRFEATSPTRKFVMINAAGSSIFINYLALEIIFCEETRIAYGGVTFGQEYSPYTGSGNIDQPYTLGMNSIHMRTALSLTSNPVLPPGSYSVVLSSANVGNLAQLGVTYPGAVGASAYPLVNAVREQASLPSHSGVQVNLTQTVGKVFTKEVTHTLPQLSLHTSSGTITEVHVYGRQAVAQVYGSLTALQEVLDSAAGGATTWPNVRFVARRFGDTAVALTLDCPAIPASTVSITPADFDALTTDIVDGWKTVDLTFATPPTMGAGTAPQWRFSAAGELIGNRWEVLGATAPALSGVPGNLLNLVPSPNQLSIATYGAPVSGSQVDLTWIPAYAPPVSAIVDDPTSDAFIVFGRGPAAVSGLSVVTTTQAITGIGLNCGINPCGIPTALLYNQISWNPVRVVSAFSSPAVSGWGSTDSPVLPWVVSGGVSGDYSVSAGSAKIANNTVNVRRNVYINAGSSYSDGTSTVDITDPIVPTGASHTHWLTARGTDVNNYYALVLEFMTTGVARLFMGKRIGGSFQFMPTDASSFLITVGTHTAGDTWRLKFNWNGPNLRGKAWLASNPEPSSWQISGFDNELTLGTLYGVIDRLEFGSTDSGTVVSFDNFTLNADSTAEIQRSDSIDSTWYTIALAPQQNASFNDYEARVGISSSYRIRTKDSFGFSAGWSSSVSLTMPAPGVSGSCFSNDNHVMIFTTNEMQNGRGNLAYSNAWEGGAKIEENFTFPEAGFTQLQAMYNRDDFVAFTPIERGGDQFTRTLLVQAAAIPAPTLTGFKSLQDMAWNNVSYVCVRDEDGNRWFAHVGVPSGKVTNRRKLYLATVNITEVTETPSQVTP